MVARKKHPAFWLGLALAASGVPLVVDGSRDLSWIWREAERYPSPVPLETLLGRGLPIVWSALVVVAGLMTAFRPSARHKWGFLGSLAGLAMYATSHFWSPWSTTELWAALAAAVIGAILAWKPLTNGWRVMTWRLLAISGIVALAWIPPLVIIPETAVDTLPMGLQGHVLQWHWDWHYRRGLADAESLAAKGSPLRYSPGLPSEESLALASALYDQYGIRTEFPGCLVDIRTDARKAAHDEILRRWMSASYGRDLVAATREDYRLANFDCLMKQGTEGSLDCGSPGSFESMRLPDYADPDDESHHGYWVRRRDPAAAERWERWR